MENYLYLSHQMDFRFSHIFWDGNTCVDKLASYGFNSSVFTWWDLVLNFIKDDFNCNRIGLPNYIFK